MKPRIKSVVWNLRKQKTTMQNNEKKKEFLPKMRVVQATSVGQLMLDNIKRSNISIIGMPEEEK